jgi:hypothetical protein
MGYQMEKLLIKSPSEMAEDEVAIIRSRRAYLTAVERMTFKEVPIPASVFIRFKMS